MRQALCDYILQTFDRSRDRPQGIHDLSGTGDLETPGNRRDHYGKNDHHHERREDTGDGDSSTVRIPALPSEKCQSAKLFFKKARCRQQDIGEDKSPEEGTQEHADRRRNTSKHF